MYHNLPFFISKYYIFYLLTLLQVKINLALGKKWVYCKDTELFTEFKDGRNPQA